MHAAVILLSLLSCVTTCLGVVVALALGESARAIAAGIGFSAGLMILIALVELLPQAMAGTHAADALATAALGAGAVWSVHLVTPHFHLFEEAGMADRVLRRSAMLVALGMVLHDVPEGFAMANAYIASPSLGVLVAVAIALHNLPEAFVIAVPAVASKSKPLLLGAALLSALAEPVGALIGLAAVHVAPAMNARFLALAAGAMLFVSVHELIPLARRYRHTGMFALGALTSALIWGLMAHVVGHVR
jgi:ZIP family zinc transporter